MPDTVPSWLAGALKGSGPGDGRLVVAGLGDERGMGRGGFALSSPAFADGDEPVCHWLVWGLPAQRAQLLEGETPPRVGKNAHRNSEWLLPEPPREDGARAPQWPR